jgi:hypothetical protein
MSNFDIYVLMFVPLTLAGLSLYLIAKTKNVLYAFTFAIFLGMYAYFGSTLPR